MAEYPSMWFVLPTSTALALGALVAARAVNDGAIRALASFSMVERFWGRKIHA